MLLFNKITHKKIKSGWILVTIFLVAFFVVFFYHPNYSLAADNNTNDSKCVGGGAPNYTYKCDLDEEICSKARGTGWPYKWTSNGYASGAGNKNCCGDDSQENFLSCQTSSEGGVSCGSNINACCDINSKCVYNGTCYTRSGFNGVNTNDTSNDLEFCLGYFDHDLPSRWFDQDTDKSAMGSSLCEAQGNYWFPLSSSCKSAGPGGVCDDADGGAFCCGDDSSEYHTQGYYEVGPRDYLYITWGSQITNKEFCCSQDGSCIKPNNTCAAPNNQHSGLNSGGADNAAYCQNLSGDGYWRDCDVVAQGFNVCNSSVCGNSSGVYAGESGVGEYPDTSTLGCCGDDANEYNITQKCPGATASALCCNSSSDKISSSNTCVSSCGTPPASPISPSGMASECSPDLPQAGTTRSMNVYFTDNSTNETGFYVYRNTSNNFSSSQRIATLSSSSGTGTTLSYDDYDLASCGYYYYWATSYNAYGESSSKAVGTGTGICAGSPTHPNNVHITNTTQTSITWDWDDLSGASSYTAVLLDENLNVLSASTVYSSNYTATGLTQGKTYNLAVYGYYAGACNGGTCPSCFSAASSGTTTTCTPPSSISNLREISTGQTSITWDWNNVSGTVPISYYVWVDGSYKGATSVSNYTATGLSCNASHTIIVEASNSCGTSGMASDSALTTSCCSGTDTSCGTSTCINCNNSDGWYNVGATYACCDGIYRCSRCQEQEYRNYYCSGTSCSYSITQSQTVEADCTTCADNLSCTTDSCSSAVCSNTIQSGNCLINGQCYANGAVNPSNECQACNSSQSQTSWSNKSNGTACGSFINYCADTSICDTRQHKRYCSSGSCVGEWTNDQNTSGTSCSGSSCGSYPDYCLATPGKLRDYTSSAGICSSSSETCDQPSYSDYCKIGQCGAECQSNNCSTSQCDAYGGQTYRQIRSNQCQSNCLCLDWSAYQSCEQSYNNCEVECYTGTGCNTATNACYCTNGYQPNGSGGCVAEATYYWDIGSWSDCSVECGTGTQTRTIICRRSAGDQEVDDSYCTPPKPASSQSCNAGSCSPTVCPADGCYGDYKWDDYPYSIPNSCNSGVCADNTCSATQSCSVSLCGAECQSNNCSTSQCEAYGGQTYLQTRSATCTNCLCPAWSAFATCQQSYNNCEVECYTGTGCNTATNACSCQSGYVADGDGGCSLSAEPTFSLSNSGSITLQQGGPSQDVTINVLSQNSFNSQVNLSENCSNSGLACIWASGNSCTPPANSSCSKILRMSAGSALVGTYNVAVTGSGATYVGVTVVAAEGTNTAPNAPTNLKQFDNEAEMQEGDLTNDQTPYFTFTISDPDTGDLIGYQIQIDDSDSFGTPVIDFTWDGSATNPNSVTYNVPSGSELDDSNYFWRVRAKDGDGAYSNWVLFGGGGVDFKVNTRSGTPPIANFSWCKYTEDTVQLIDTSTIGDSAINSWAWDFGDGETCQPNCNETGYNGTNQYPVHTFEGGGSGSTPWSFTLEAEDINHQCGGLCCGNTGWNIWSACEIYDNVNFPETTAYQFDVIAKGDFAGGEWPNMELRIDSQVKGSATVNSSDWQTYSFSNIDLTAGNHQVAVAFTNDYWDPPADRNLLVDKINISGEIGGGGGSGGWWNNDWQYRKKITFNNSSRGNLDNAPVLVKLTNSNFDFSRALAQGQDVRFVDSDNSTILSHEIEYWNQGQQKAEVWVKVPRINSNSSSDFIYLYYNGPSGSYQNAENVWDANYVGVWHLHNDFLDSTSNNNDGNNNGSDDTIGKIADGQDFNGTSDYISVGNKPSLRLTGAMTVEAWGVLDTVENRRLVAKQGGGGGNRSWSLNTENVDGKYHFMIGTDNGNDGIRVTSNSSIPIGTNTWAYWAGVFQPSAALRIYVNGNLDNSNTTGIPSSQYNNNLDVWLGARNECGNCWWDGKVDEVRISNIVRSSDWISFQGCSMEQSCVSYSTEEINSAGVTLTIIDAEDDISSKSQDLNLATLPYCAYNLNSVSSLNCHTIDLSWSAPTFFTPASYLVYNSSVSDVGPWSYVGTTASTIFSHYSQTDIQPEQTYWYYITTNPLEFNNSTISPACSGGTTLSGNVCPLQVVTPVCVFAASQLETSRSCGQINLSWDGVEDAKAYQIQKSSGSASNFNDLKTVSQSEISTYCSSGNCVYSDKEIIPVNTTNPPDALRYWYRIRVQTQDDKWSEWSASANDYSYCYRAPSWQER